MGVQLNRVLGSAETHQEVTEQIVVTGVVAPATIFGINPVSARIKAPKRQIE